MNTNRFFSNEVLGPKYGKLIQEIFEIPQSTKFFLTFTNKLNDFRKVLDKDIEEGLLTGKCLENAKQISFYCKDIIGLNLGEPSQIIEFSHNNKINYLKIIFNPKRKEREISSIREVMRKSRLIVYTGIMVANVKAYIEHFNDAIIESKETEGEEIMFKSLFINLAPEILLVLFGRYARTIKPEDDAKRFYLLAYIKYYSLLKLDSLEHQLIFFFYTMQGEERIAEYLKESPFTRIDYKNSDTNILGGIPISKHDLMMNKN